MDRPVKTQVTTLFHNTLCSRPECYSNCHKQCKLGFSLDPNTFKPCGAMTDGRCKKCRHPAINHRHYSSTWEETMDTQVVVDKDAQRKFYAASKDRCTYQQALTEVEAAIKDLDSEIEHLSHSH